MPLLALCLAVFALLAVILALVVAIRGPRAANRMTGGTLPDALRGGNGGGFLTALENIDGRWTRVALLGLFALVCGGGAWLVVAAG